MPFSRTVSRRSWRRRNEGRGRLAGKTLAEVAALRGTLLIEMMMDLVVEDDSRVGTVY